MARNDTIFSVKTGKPLETVCEDLRRSVAEHQFGVMTEHNLKETMAKKGVAFDQECRIFEVCNPHQAKTILEGDMAMSTALPCRISVYREGEETVLSTIRPTALLGMLMGGDGGNGGAAAVAEEVEVTMAAIMDGAARS